MTVGYNKLNIRTSVVVHANPESATTTLVMYSYLSASSLVSGYYYVLGFSDCSSSWFGHGMSFRLHVRKTILDILDKRISESHPSRSTGRRSMVHKFY